MLSQGQDYAAEVLESRKVECENCLQLRVKGEKQFIHDTIMEVKAHVNLTKSLWKSYPLPLQVRISFRFILEQLRTISSASKGKRDDEQERLWDSFASHITLDSTGGSLEFLGEKTTLLDLLTVMREKADKLDSLAVESALDCGLSMDVEAALQQAISDKQEPEELVELKDGAKARMFPALGLHGDVLR